MSEDCAWLHKRLECLPLIKFPFERDQLPENGIYFFYEKGEICGHRGIRRRIVRIGTHRDGNFRNRIGEHYLLSAAKMKFDNSMPAPKDRSIFRKNLGRALLRKRGDRYADLWEVDFTTSANRNKYRVQRDISHELMIEGEITNILRETFSFRFVSVPEEVDRLGSLGLERALIGTCARCDSCKPSSRWLGLYSPKSKIRESGLWLVQHLAAHCLTAQQRKMLERYVKQTEKLVRT